MKNYTNTKLASGALFAFSLLLIFASALLVAPAPLTAASINCTVYVATNGSDSNTGRDINSPFATGGKAASIAQPGDTICFRAGSYPGFSIPELHGTASAPITFRNYPGEHAVLDAILGAANSFVRTWGNGEQEHGGDMVVLYGLPSYLVFDGFEMTDSDSLIDLLVSLNLDNPTDLQTFKSHRLDPGFGIGGITINGDGTSNRPHHLTFQNLDMHRGMVFGGDHDDATFINNRVYDTPRKYGMYSTGKRWLFRGNKFYHLAYGLHLNGCSGPYPDGASSHPTQDSIFENNTFYNIGNTVWYFEPSGIVAYGGDAFNVCPSINNTYRNNLIYDVSYNTPRLDSGGNGLRSPGGNNNVVVNNTFSMIHVAAVDFNGNTNDKVQNNISYLNYAPSAFIHGSGDLTDHNLTTDPLFVNPSSGDFHLTTGSPAIDAGIVIPGVTDGYLGSAPDIGACEYGDPNCPRGGGGTPIPTPTPTPTPTPPPPPNTCQNLWNSTLAVPANFGASFNFFSSAQELLMQAFCGSAGAYFQVGNSSPLEYIYKIGYTWNGTTWSPFNYSGPSFSSDGNWIIGQASTAFPSIDLTQKQSALAYICDWNGSKWNCGCHDQTCATNYWNLQQFKQ